MDLSINTLRKSFFPKGNAITRRYKRNLFKECGLNGTAMVTAAGGIATLITNDIGIALTLTGMSVGSASLAKIFTSKVKMLKYPVIKIVERYNKIKSAGISVKA